jgi:hypothetical protein
MLVLAQVSSMNTKRLVAVAFPDYERVDLNAFNATFIEGNLTIAMARRMPR